MPFFCSVGLSKLLVAIYCVLCCLDIETHSVPMVFPSRTHEALSNFGISEQYYNETLKDTEFLLSDTITKFSRNIYRTLAEDDKNTNKNIIFSPFTIHLVLSMLYYGSHKGSNTWDQLYNSIGSGVESRAFSKSAFHYLDLLQKYDQQKKQSDSQIEMANKIFLQQGFVPKSKFLGLLLFYLTTSETVNFENSQEAATSINRFVDEKTKGLIKEIVSPDNLDHLTRLVLVNAIYFKAGWKYKFNKRFTRPMPFTLLDNTVIQHQQGMTTTSKLRSGRSQELDANILELPYAKSNYNMYILVPENNNIQSLNQLAASFDISEIEGSLQSSFNTNIEVTIPAFEVSFDIDLKENMKRMGMTSMFIPEEADFSEISDQELFVGDVFHRAQIKVNEEGSEAAAATSVLLGIKSFGKPIIPEFRVDRPFIYIIYDKLNKIPLFIGRMLNPSTS